MIPRIRRVYIQNFRSIDRTVVDLEPLTVLVGPNGAGKSNFVQALTLVRKCIADNLVPAFNFFSPIPRWSSDSPEEVPLTIRLDLQLNEEALAEYSFALRFDLKKNITVLREKCSVLRSGIEVAGFEIAEGSFIREIPGIRPQISPDRLALAAASAVPEFRPVYDLLSSIWSYSIHPDVIARAIGPEAPSDNLDPSGRNAVAVLRAIQEKSPEDHARIERLMASAVEGVREVRANVIEHWGPFIEFTKDFGEESSGGFHSSEMSDGTLRLLGLLLAIYQPRRPGVLIVEEPEATVHPAIAELVMQVFRDASRRQQVILTTHSPDLLDAKELSDDQIRVVSQQHGRTVIAPLGHASRQAIRERLYTPGELLRLAELSDDAEGALAAAAACDPFAEIPAST